MTAKSVLMRPWARASTNPPPCYVTEYMQCSSTFAIRVALLYLFFKSCNCWIFSVASLSKCIQFDL